MFNRGFMATLLLACLLLGAGAAFADEEGSVSERGSESSTAAKDLIKEPIVTLKTNRGDIVLRFFPDKAPEHVKNFIEHSKSGYYTGCTFHRVIPGFMIQGGDPNSKDDDPSNDGTGGYSYKGPGTKLKAEFNDTKHLRGIISAARSQSPNSAGSQFFLMHAKASHLDGKYTAYGEIIDGIDVLDKIVNAKCGKGNRPLKDQKIEEVIVGYWTTEKVEATKAAMWEADKGKKKDK